MGTTYTIVFTKTALKMLKKIDYPLQKLIKMKLTLLQNNFESFSQNLKPLKGKKDFYRFRVANYRVIFEKKNEKLILLIIRIGHRKEVY